MSKDMDSIIEKHLNIYFLIEEEPHTVKEIKNELDLPDQTIRDALERLERIRRVKKTQKGPYTFAGIDYFPEIDRVKTIMEEVMVGIRDLLDPDKDKEEVPGDLVNVMKYVLRKKAQKLHAMGEKTPSVQIGSEEEREISKKMYIQRYGSIDDEKFNEYFEKYYGEIKKLVD